MHINIKDILAAEMGYRKHLEFTDERPDLPDIKLVDGLNGDVTITGLEEGLLVAGQVEAQLELECHRCLRPFVQTFQVEFSGDYHFGPVIVEGDDWTIAKDDTIDLAPLIRQEILLALPIQLLDTPECPGLCTVCGELNEAGHRHESRDMSQESSNEISSADET